MCLFFVSFFSFFHFFVFSFFALFYFVEKVYGEESYMQYYPLLLYSVVPLVNATLYTYLAKALNDFEEHPTVVIRKNMLVIKVKTCCVVRRARCLFS